MQDSIMAAVLAGGRGSRMGQDKATVLYRERPLIHHGLAVLKSLFPRVVIVGRQPGWIDEAGVDCVPDLYPGEGPVGGLAGALEAAGGAAVFLVGCDMPFLSPAAIELVIDRLPGAQAAIPFVHGHLQSLHAAYAASCLPTITEMFAAGQRSMRGLASRLEVHLIEEEEMRRVDPELQSVMSLNRLEDFG